MDFIRDIHEARLTRNANNLKALTYTDCCERTFLTILILEVLREYPTYLIAAQKYAKQSSQFDLYKNFRINGTDLYNFLYFLTSDEGIEKLKDPEAARAMKENTNIPVMAINRYLKEIASGKSPSNVTNFLIKLESSLKITNSDYKTIRRAVSNYRELTTDQRKKAVSRLIIAARAKLRTADIIDEFEKLAADKNLESERVVDNEPKVSVPDVMPSVEDLARYRYLVGTENLVQAKQLVDNFKAGRGCTSNQLQAYGPIIKMIDDIVQGGPSYIQRLRALHERAKKSR